MIIMEQKYCFHSLKSSKWLYVFCTLQVIVTFDVALCTVSIYNMIGISLDRFLAVFRPTTYSTITSTTTNMTILSAWLLGLTVALPMYIQSPGFCDWSITTLPTNQTVCRPPNDEMSRGFSIYAAFMAFIIPFTVLIVLYLAIALKMRSVSKLKLLRLNTSLTSTSRRFSSKDISAGGKGRRMEEDDGGDMVVTRTARRQVKQEEARQRRITLMVGTIVLTFLVCWFPFALMFALSPFSQHIEDFFTDNNLVDFVTWLGKSQTDHHTALTDLNTLTTHYSGYTNSFLNPVIYAIMNPSIRTTMKKQLENIFC